MTSHEESIDIKQLRECLFGQSATFSNFSDYDLLSFVLAVGGVGDNLACATLKDDDWLGYLFLKMEFAFECDLRANCSGFSYNVRVLCGVANESDYAKDFVDTENQVFKRLMAEAEVEAGQKIISQILLFYFYYKSYYSISIILFL